MAALPKANQSSGEDVSALRIPGQALLFLTHTAGEEVNRKGDQIYHKVQLYHSQDDGKDSTPA